LSGGKKRKLIFVSIYKICFPGERGKTLKQTGQKGASQVFVKKKGLISLKGSASGLALERGTSPEVTRSEKEGEEFHLYGFQEKG